MSDSEAKYNLLKSSCFTQSVANSRNDSHAKYALGADGWVCGVGIDNRSWDAKNAEWAVELPAGAYVLLYEVDGKQGNVWDGFGVYVGDSKVNYGSHHDGPYVQKVAFELSAASTVHVMVKCYAPASYRLMLVEGDTPAAWAPAEGETLAGGGASMSANLLAGVTPTLAYGSMADGVITSSTPKDNWTDVAFWQITTGTLAENQTMHIGISAKWHGAAATTGAAWASVKYADTAGNTNSVNTHIDGITTEWKRLSLSAVVPSGMRIVDFHISGAKLDAAYDVANPVLSYGSPVTLASDAHTPYATQDHVAAEYSTKASQKILSDSIASEVNARAKTDGAVSELSTKMEQTVNGINVSLDKLTATERQIHSWFDFGSDASGNPKLAMGSSSSPIIGEYSNTGTTYKDRSGATLLALDAANSTTGADHVVAKDMTVGKWKWVPTNGGDNLTLVWTG